MTFFCLFLLVQELGVETPSPLQAVFILNNKDEIHLTDLQVKGPDPFFLTISHDNETEFIPLYRISKIERIQGETDKFVVSMDGKEDVTTQIKAQLFTGRENPESRHRTTIRLNRIQSMQIQTTEQLKSCPNCEYEAKTDYWYCPRCGSELQMGSFEENQQTEPVQPSLIRYRVDSR